MVPSSSSGGKPLTRHLLGKDMTDINTINEEIVLRYLPFFVIIALLYDLKDKIQRKMTFRGGPRI